MESWMHEFSKKKKKKEKEEVDACNRLRRQTSVKSVALLRSGESATAARPAGRRAVPTPHAGWFSSKIPRSSGAATRRCRVVLVPSFSSFYGAACMDHGVRTSTREKRGPEADWDERGVERKESGGRT
jgi:hypothetical protein